MTIAKTMTLKDLKLQPLPNLTTEQRQPWDAYYNPRNEEFRTSNLSGRELVSWKYQRYMHDYLGCILAVDESVGRILKYLDDEGLAGNTIVVYSSDQGFFLGEHGWFDKRWIFEESVRTPLLVRWPGVTAPGSVSNEIVSNLDFAQTLLDAAGLPKPAEMQGRSLVPILKGKTPADWRKSFYYQYFEYPTPHHVSPHYGVITDRYKLIHFSGPENDYWELYDLKEDPGEMHDVFNKEEYEETRKTLETELKRLRAEYKVPETIPASWYGNKPAGNATH